MVNIEEEINEIVISGSSQRANNLFEEYHPVDIGQVIEELDEDDLKDFINLLLFQNVALLLESSEDEVIVKITSFFTNGELIQIFTHMETSLVADLLGLLSTFRRKEILSTMKKSDSNVLKMILSFDEESAGGIMTTNFISLRETLTVEEAIAKIRTISPETEIIEEIFVTDNLHRLKGYVTIRDLLVSASKTQLIDIAEEIDFYVKGSDDQEEAANLFSKYELDVLPVVNANMAILGVITSEDIISVIDQEYSEDILQMHGVNADEEYDSSILQSFKSRVPWLVVNLATAFLASSVVKGFESTISQVVVLSAAMPVVTGMGGNAGSQTLSIILTSLARGEMSLKEDFKLIIKEIFLGLSEGAIIGIIAGAVFTIWHKNIYLGIILFLAMILNMIIACSMGFFIPLFLDKLKVDPAVASSIFLTTFTDVCGFFIFLGLATMFLPLLL